MDAVKILVRKRAIFKTKITKALTNFEACTDGSVDPEILKGVVNANMKDIQEMNDQINDLYLSDVSGNYEVQFEAEISAQTDYDLDIGSKLKSICSVDVKSSVNVQPSNCILKLPELKCDTFSGEGSSNLEFFEFMTKFDNIVGLRDNLSKSTKFTYLKTYLKGYALKLVQHLTVTDENYDEALKLLRAEFLNINALIHDLFKKLLELKPKFDANFLGTKLFISEVRCILSDLNNYQCNLLQDDASNTFVSHIIFEKLPFSFRQELVRKCNDNYPNLDVIFTNYTEVIKTLMIRQGSTIPKAYMEPSAQRFNNARTTTNVAAVQPKPLVKNCKFCNANHSMLKCTRYATYDSRVARCKVLKLCVHCSSLKHSSCKKPLDFECYSCKSRDHISALCPKITPVNTCWCINMAHSGGRTYILPTVTVEVTYGQTKTRVRCLIDTGSQRSYISGDVAGRLGIGEGSVEKQKFFISTFLDQSSKIMSELSLSVSINEMSAVLPFYIDEGFDLSYSIDGLSTAFSNIGKKFSLADPIYSDKVLLEGLLGVDALQYMELNTISCLSGVAFQLSAGDVIPFGSIDNFLSYKELIDKYDDRSPVNQSDREFLKAITNFVDTPLNDQIDFFDREFDENLAKMFSVEGIGLPETNDFDDNLLIDFDKNIELKNGNYYVEMPWSERVAEVQPNFEICRSILQRVHVKLITTNNYDNYNNVFNEYLTDNIVEQVAINSDCTGHVYIPHRPVFKWRKT